MPDETLDELLGIEPVDSRVTRSEPETVDPGAGGIGALLAHAARSGVPQSDPVNTGLDVGLSMIGGSQGLRAATGLARAKGMSPALGSLTRFMGQVTGGAAGGAAAAGLTGRDPGRGALEGGAGEVLGRGTEAVARPVLGLGARLLQGGLNKLRPAGFGAGQLLNPAAGATKAVDELARLAETPSLGQVSDSRLIQTMESIAESDRLFGGGRILEATRRPAEQAARQRAEDFVDGMLRESSPEDVGRFVLDLIEDRSTAFRANSNALYAKMDDLIGDQPMVDVRSLKDWAAKQLENTALPSAQSQSIGVLRDIVALDDVVTFRSAANLRTSLNMVGESGSDLIKGASRGAAKKLAGDLTSKMDSAAANVSPQAKEAWRAANNFWRRGIRNFNDKSILALTRKDPEKVAESLIPMSGRARVTTLDRISAIAGQHGERQVMQRLGDAFLGRLVNTASKAERVPFSGQSPLEVVDARKVRQGLALLGEESLVKLYGKGRAKKLTEVFRTLELTQRTAERGGAAATKGLPSVTLFQAGALGTMIGVNEFTNSEVSNAQLAAGLGIILGPRALAWMLTDPQTVKLLAGSRKAGVPGTRTASRLFGQLAARSRVAQRIFGSEEVRILNEGPTRLNDQQRQELQ